MHLRTFWLGWRRDIVRLAMLCLAAVAVALLINHGRTRAREGIAGLVPGRALDGLAHDLKGLSEDADLSRPGRTAAAPWRYRARLTPGQGVWVRGLRGAISIEPARGESVEVSAVKTYGASDPGVVAFVTTPTPAGVVICGMWGADGRCSAGDDYKQGNSQDNDVAVAFTVRVPRGVRIDASTVTGSVRVAGASAPVVAQTVDGSVTVETGAGPVDAHTVNGSVSAVVRGFAGPGAVKLGTVNGSVILDLPTPLDARIEANTMNGSVYSDFPLKTTDKFVIHHATGTVGAGGRKIELHAINGSVRVRAIPLAHARPPHAVPVPPAAPAVPQPPQAP
ncbi:MAG TPA: hypothetical protein VLV16_04170 [Gemmatimonadales bacterium]|nr:hypothetical protein [Gemmatimonadales bacterium]